MEPKIAMPLYKWFIITALILLLGIITLLAVSILSQMSVMETVPDVEEHSYDFLIPGTSDTPSKKLRDPNAEVRGIWIATVENIDFPSKPGIDADELKAELDDIVATANKNGFNAIYFQVRPAADAFYDSAYFPVSKYLTGTQGSSFPDGFDPLAYLIQIAHAEDIYVHAWVNPLRVTSGTSEAPNHDLTQLAQRNPARLYPEWTIPYADGKLYFDAGIPEVRKLIADGVAEIARNYRVDGIVFDDYFYPYPVSGATFDDENTYKTYGGDFTSKGDWRRENVNLMVQACYDAVKTVNTDCKFGIAPFGVWQNDNGSNGGSDTKGLNSYSEIYCDALAWIRGGYIDYIAPQIYWTFNSTAARFDVLARWWNQQLEGYENIDLLICHAMYRSAEWNIAHEIRNQIEFARSGRSYIGSIMYGYAALKRNDMDLEKQLQEAYKYDYVYSSIESDDSNFNVSSPASGSYLNVSNTYLIGTSDPGYPLYFEGKPVSRTKGGYFSLYVNLKYGENKFVFEHKDEEFEYIVNRGTAPAAPTVYQTMDEFKILSFKPTNDYLVPGGTVIEVSVTAPSKSTVKAKLRNEEITLWSTINPPNESDYMLETYTGKFTVPNWAGEGEISSLGNITFTAVRGDETDSAIGANVRIAGWNAFVVVEVARNDMELKVSETSWYYDDYTPAQKGMRDEAVSLQNGFYKLRMGGYLQASGVTEIKSERLGIAKMTNAYMTTDAKETVFYIDAGENVPANGYVDGGNFVFTLYNVDVKTAKDIKIIDNPMIKSIKSETYNKTNAIRYVCALKDSDNFYGFEFGYTDGVVTVSLRNPQTLPRSSTPLEGKVIVIDAGHGGRDSGARGPDITYNEADMNLDMAMAAVRELEKLGATVITTRTENVTVDIYDRLDLLIEVNPDLVISIHQNSMPYDSDITKIRGLIGLYFADSGKLLTKTVSAAVANTLNRLERTPTLQRLAMVRNPKFPSTLIEVGFITCVEEYDLMRRQVSADRAGKGIAQGVLDCYRAQEKFLK